MIGREVWRREMCKEGREGWGERREVWRREVCKEGREGWGERRGHRVETAFTSLCILNSQE